MNPDAKARLTSPHSSFLYVLIFLLNICNIISDISGSLPLLSLFEIPLWRRLSRWRQGKLERSRGVSSDGQSACHARPETEVSVRVRRRGFTQWVSVGVLFIFERSINAQSDFWSHIAFSCTGFLQRRFFLLFPALASLWWDLLT